MIAQLIGKLVFGYRLTPRRPINNAALFAHDDQAWPRGDVSGTVLAPNHRIYQRPTTYEGIAVPNLLIGDPAGSMRSFAPHAGRPPNWGILNYWVGQGNRRRYNLNNLTALATPDQAAAPQAYNDPTIMPDYMTESAYENSLDV